MHRICTYNMELS